MRRAVLTGGKNVAAAAADRKNASLPVSGLRKSARVFLLDFTAPFLTDNRLMDSILVYRQLATLLQAGISLGQALSLREDRAKPGLWKQALHAAIQRVEHGGKLSDALAKQTSLCSEIEVELIRAGENGGFLDRAVGQVADSLEREQSIRRFLHRQTNYTKSIIFALVFVFPLLMSAATGVNPLPGLLDSTLFLAWFGFLAGMAVAITRAIMRQSGAAAILYERIKRVIPGMGAVYRDFSLARFCRALGSLYAAGIGLPSGLQIAGRASGSLLLERAGQEASATVAAGLPLGVALRATDRFSERAIEMAETGAESGDLDVLMSRLAGYLESEAEERAQKSAYVIGKVVYILVILWLSGGLLILLSLLLRHL